MVIKFFFLFIYLLFSFFVFLFSPLFFPSYTFTDSPHPLLLCLQNTPPWATRLRRGSTRTGSIASGCTSPSSLRLHQARGSASWRFIPRGTTPFLLSWQLPLPLLCSSPYTPAKSSLLPLAKSNPLHPSIRHLPSSAVSHSSSLAMAHAIGD
jgi:hypothetical protein